MKMIRGEQLDCIDEMWVDDLRDGIWPRSLAVSMAAFYLAMFILRPWEKLIPELATVHFERWCAILMIAVVVLGGRFRVRLDFAAISVLLVTAAFCCSGLLVRGFSVPYVFVTLVAFYFILYAVIRSPYELLWIVAFYLVTMGIYLSKSLWEYFIHGAGITEMGVRRLQGMDMTYSNDNALAASVVYSLPILWFFYNVRAEFCATWPDFWRKWFVRGLAGYAVLAAVSVMLTRSRMGVVGLIAFMVLLAMRKGSAVGKLASVASIVLVCICTYFVVPADIQGRLQTMWKPVDVSDASDRSAHASAEGRLAGLKAGIIMFKQHPIFGVGLDNFASYRVAHVGGEGLDAHNLEGALLGETGIVGCACFTLLVLVAFANCRRVHSLARKCDDQQLVVLGQFTQACRDTLLLLLILGQVSYNLQRFNWLWTAAFCSLAVVFAVERYAIIGVDGNESSVM